MSKTTYEEYLKRYASLTYKNTGTSMLPLLKHSSKFAGVIRKKFLFLESVQAAEAVGIPSVQLDQPLHSELTLRVQLARIWLSKRPVLLLDNAFAGLSEDDRLFLQQFRSVYKELHADRETGC